MTEPFLSDPITLEPTWIDWNGHLNMAYYNVIFDRALDAFLAPTGIGPDYVAARAGSTMVVEVHVCYLREVFLDTQLRVRARILGLDDKRLHLFCELIHADEGWVSATSEQMILHVDLTTRRVAPWPADIRAALEDLAASTRSPAPPERAGRTIAMPAPRA